MFKFYLFHKKLMNLMYSFFSSFQIGRHLEEGERRVSSLHQDIQLKSALRMDALKTLKLV